MSLVKSMSKKANSGNIYQYGFLSLYKLIRRIVDKADRQALIEFHHRQLFKFRGEENLTCTEFVARCRKEFLLRENAIRNSFEIADRAYDLTTDKFSNLYDTPGDAEEDGTEKNQLERNRSDCRLYFRAILNHLDRSFKQSSNKGQLEMEAKAAAAVQGFVNRHFYLSVKEAKRKVNPLWSRYFWNVGGRKICVWLPVYLKGWERPEWLEKNIETPITANPRERERIQAQINQKLGNVGVIPFNEILHQRILEKHENRSDPKKDVSRSLGEVVAKEKADNIAYQRRAIKALGEKKLKQMIQHIFEKIAEDNYHDIAVAKTFGLSKATFSRFAGSRWNTSKTNIPDLWLNTAQVLSVHPDFKKAAVKAGVWKQVEITLSKVRKQKSNNE